MLFCVGMCNILVARRPPKFSSFLDMGNKFTYNDFTPVSGIYTISLYICNIHTIVVLGEAKFLKCC